MKPVYGIGIAVLDHLIVVPETARHGGWVSEYRMEGGGLTASAIVAASRLGAPTRLWTCLGDDEAGRTIIGGLAAAGVDTSRIRIVADARSPVSIVHIEMPAGERVIYHFPGDAFEKAGAQTGDRHRSENDWSQSPLCLPDLDGLEQAGALLVDYCWHAAALAGARRARAAGIPVIGDFDPRRDPELAAALDWLIVGEQVAQSLAPGQDIEGALGKVRAFGARCVGITMGARGCWYWENGVVRHCPAFEIKVVDTTGAGDAFHGAFGFALAQGWTVEEAVRLGCAVGALACTALGGRKGLPDLATAIELMRGRGTEKL